MRIIEQPRLYHDETPGLGLNGLRICLFNDSHRLVATIDPESSIIIVTVITGTIQATAFQVVLHEVNGVGELDQIPSFAIESKGVRHTSSDVIMSLGVTCDVIVEERKYGSLWTWSSKLEGSSPKLRPLSREVPYLHTRR